MTRIVSARIGIKTIDLIANLQLIHQVPHRRVLSSSQYIYLLIETDKHGNKDHKNWEFLLKIVKFMKQLTQKGYK